MLRFILGLCLASVLLSGCAGNAPRSVELQTIITGNAPRSAELQTIIESLQLEKEKPLNDEALVNQFNRVIVAQHQKGQYQPALLIAQLNQQHAETSLGQEHPATLTSINNLALLYQAQGRYAKAEPLYQRALQARERVLGKEHPATLTSVNNLAFLYEAQGRYAEATPLLQRALQARERVLGKEHPDTLTSVNNLAGLYESQGRYTEAEPLYQRAVQAFERVLGKEHPDTLTSVNNLAALYESQGRYAEAEPLYQRALQASERVLGKEHPQTLTSVNNLAGLYESQGRYAEAEPLYQRAMQARERLLGQEHPDTLTSVNNLAFLYQAQGRNAEAEPLYQRAMQASERVLGKEHPQTLTSVNNLALLYQSQGHYAEAEPLYQRALQARERVLGQAHPDTLSIRLNVAANLLSRHKAPQCLEQLQRYESGLFQLAGRELRQENDLRDKRQLLRKHSKFQSLAFSLALQHPSAQTERFAATVLLRWQQVEGEEQLVLQRLLRQSSDSEIQQLAQQLADQRQMFSAAAHQKPFNRSRFDLRKQQLQDLEQSLATKSPGFKQRLAIGQVDVSDLEGVLEDKTGLLVLRTFNPYNPKTGKLDALHWLAAWMAPETSGQMRVRWYDLGAVEDSEAVWQATQRDPKASQGLYQHLFSKLDPLIAGAETLYIVSDHFLHLTDFGSWRLPNGDFWLQRQSIRRLHTARDLLRRQHLPQSQGFVAFGGIEYGAPTARPPATDQPQPMLNESLLAQRGLEGGFAPLPATRKEVDHFERDFWDRKRIGPLRVLKGPDATEHFLKHIAHPPRILHLATHGFYLDDQQYTQRPLVSSGLALAHANQGLQGKRDKDQEDGILFALEAVDLNLEGTELVTLSACETGQGEFDYSEGVYGLVLAFKLAGANNVLMTLRKVNDEWAMRFMKKFYFEWLSGAELHPALALRQTKLHFINKGDAVERDPKFWSPYVLVETTGSGSEVLLK